MAHGPCYWCLVAAAGRKICAQFLATTGASYTCMQVWIRPNNHCNHIGYP